MNQVYLDTARLMTRVAPLVFADNIFALKGGTAINLFLRDMPRLSVDLDLVFVDRHLSRDKALGSINAAIRKAAGCLEANGFRTQITTVAEVCALQHKRKNPVVTRFLSGSRSWTRTNDPLINSQLLYQLSYSGPRPASFQRLARPSSCFR